jgi:hypothetical protein
VTKRAFTVLVYLELEDGLLVRHNARVRSLRTQLIGSHMVLVMLMTVVMGGAVFNFFQVSRSVDAVLRGNFQTVLSARDIEASIQQQETAWVLLVDGDQTVARKTYADAMVAFNRGLRIALDTSLALKRRKRSYQKYRPKRI